MATFFTLDGKIVCDWFLRDGRSYISSLNYNLFFFLRVFFPLLSAPPVMKNTAAVVKRPKRKTRKSSTRQLTRVIMAHYTPYYYILLRLYRGGTHVFSLKTAETTLQKMRRTRLIPEGKQCVAR